MVGSSIQLQAPSSLLFREIAPWLWPFLNFHKTWFVRHVSLRELFRLSGRKNGLAQSYQPPLGSVEWGALSTPWEASQSRALSSEPQRWAGSVSFHLSQPRLCYPHPVLVAWGATKHLAPCWSLLPSIPWKNTNKKMSAMVAHSQSTWLPVSHSPWRLLKQMIHNKEIRITTCDDSLPTTMTPKVAVCKLKENTINLYSFCLPRK